MTQLKSKARNVSTDTFREETSMIPTLDDLLTFARFTLKDLEKYKGMELTVAQIVARLQENADKLGLEREKS